MQASHQLRFLREWAVFGRALRRSVWELLGVALALLLLILAYSHTGHLVRLFFPLFAPSFSLSLSLSCRHIHTKHDVNMYILQNVQMINLVRICPPMCLFTFHAWLVSHAYSPLSSQ